MAAVDRPADLLLGMFARGVDERKLRGIPAPPGDSMVRGGSLRYGHQLSVELRREYDFDLAARQELIR